MQFTNEEKKRIDLLYGNDLKDVTPDDVQLIAKWERHKLELETEQNARILAISKENEARLSAIEKQAKLAMATLQEMRDAAIKRYEVIVNGKTE